MITVESALTTQGNIKRRISEIFVDGFGMHFTFLSHDKQVLIRAFEHMFVPEAFHVALVDRAVVGIGAITDGKSHSVEPRWKELMAELGLLKGTIAYFILRNEFHKPPKRTGHRIASVEFFATDPEHRGRGVASAIMTHFVNNPNYDEFVLEVADTNEGAVNLYMKLGFVEFARVKEKHAEVSGINYLIYMSYKRG